MVTQTVTQIWSIDENGNQATLLSTNSEGWSSSLLGIVTNDPDQVKLLVANDIATFPDQE